MTWSPFFTEVTPGPDVDHDARALVAEDRREQPLRVLARQRELVGVADAGGLDLDQHLAGSGPFELHMRDRERLARLERHRRTHVHAVYSLPGFCHHQLRLRHDRGELAVAAGDAGLPDRGGAAAMQRRAFRLRHVAGRDAGEEIGLALDRGGRAAGRAAGWRWRRCRRDCRRSAISAPPCSTPLRLVSCSVTSISAVTRSGETWVIFMPMKLGERRLLVRLHHEIARCDVLSFMPSGLP